MSVSPGPYALALPLRARVVQQLLEACHRGAREWRSRTPAWAPVAVLAFVCGASVASLLNVYATRRRRWTACQLRVHRVSSVLTSLVRAAWNDVDAEDSGWLEASEARAVMDGVLVALEAPARTQQLAQLVAPAATPMQADAAADPSSSWAVQLRSSVPSSAAWQASVAPPLPDVEAEVRASLARLWPALRRDIPTHFKYFLAHMDARPSPQAGSHFTPPINQRSPAPEAERAPAHQRTPSSSSSASLRRARAHSSASTSSPPLLNRATGGSSGPDAVPAPTVGAADSSAVAAAASSSSLSSCRVFRCEFTTALVIWLESNLVQQLLTPHAEQMSNDTP